MVTVLTQRHSISRRGCAFRPLTRPRAAIAMQLDRDEEQRQQLHRDCRHPAQRDAESLAAVSLAALVLLALALAAAGTTAAFGTVDSSS